VPVLAVQGPGFHASKPPWKERLGRGLLALAASLAVTVAYHAGYAEFRGPKMLSAVIGNAIITSSYLLTGSPLAAVASHVIMHVGAVFHGMDTTLQLPPHYEP
jgi:membrane protease YdiL (CAAX protease family)